MTIILKRREVTETERRPMKTEVGKDWSDVATRQWMSGAPEARNRQERVCL